MLSLVAAVHSNHEVLIIVKLVVTRLSDSENGTRNVYGEPKRVTIGNTGERADKIRPYFHCLNLWKETIAWHYPLVM